MIQKVEALRGGQPTTMKIFLPYANMLKRLRFHEKEKNSVFKIELNLRWTATMVRWGREMSRTEFDTPLLIT